MNGPDRLTAAENNWRSRMGLSFPGERVVYRGKDLFADLGESSWMGLYLYGITGRPFSANQLHLFEAMWVISSSYPDPRLWNNRVASLAGTARSTGALGISAAVAVTEATIYGFRPIIKAFVALKEVAALAARGEDIEAYLIDELRANRTIAGYGRPVINFDERIEPLMATARRLGLADGPHVQLAFRIEEILQRRRYRLHMNVAALASALAADQGLSRREYYNYLIPCFIAGMVPCWMEASEKGEGEFLPLSCRRVAYNGPARRPWKE